MNNANDKAWNEMSVEEILALGNVPHDIIDLHTMAIVGHGKTGRSARRAAERRNQQYGGHRFIARPSK